MAYNGKLPGKDEVAKMLLDALRQDKKDVVINAEIQAEIDQQSFKAAEQQINKLTKTKKVDVDTSKAEQKIKNLMEPLREVEREIKALGSSGADFNVAHNTIKKYEQLKLAVSEATKAIGRNNQELLEAKKIIKNVDDTIKGLDITVEKATKKKRTKQTKKTADDIKAQTEAIVEQTAAVEHETSATVKHSEAVADDIQKTKERIEVQKHHIQSTEAAAKAQEKLNKAEEKSLKLKPRKDNDGKRIAGAYATDDGLFEVDHDADGWKVHRKNAAGLYELVKIAKTKNEIVRDSALIAEQEAHAQKKASNVVIDAQKKIEQELLSLSDAYEEMANRAGHSAKFAEQYGAMFKAVQGGALSAADAIAQLNVEIEKTNNAKTPNMITDGASSVKAQEQQMKKTVELIGELYNKYGDKFNDIFGSIGEVGAENAVAVYDMLINKEKEYRDAVSKRVTALNEFAQDANNNFQDIAHIEEYQKQFTNLAQQIIDGKIGVDEAKQSLTEFSKTLAGSDDQNKGLISSYKDLYRELEKLVDLSKQLKPGDTSEYEEMLQLTDNVGYVNNKEEAIAEIKAWYENIKRIKSSLKNGLSVYKHVSGDGYEYEDAASEQSLAKADATLRGYIVSAVANFGYTLAEAMDDFPKKRMRYFVEDQINKYYEIDARNSAYSADADAFNAPIQEQIDTITTGISNMATSIDNMSKATDVLFDLTSRSKDVNRYTLSTEANKIGSLIGVETPYDEIRANAKRIESYEELCRVVARYNELKGDAVVYGGKDYPGFDANVEREYRELLSRLRLTAGDDVFGKFRFDTPKDIDKLASAIGLKSSQSYETESGQLAFIEGAKESIVVENALQEEIKETNELLEGQISIEEHLADAAEKARKQLEQQADISKIVSRDIINRTLQGVDVEGFLSGYGLQGDKLTKGIDLFKDLAGARYLGDSAPKSANDIFNELFEFVSENAQHTEDVVKTMQDFREHMKHVQIQIPENMESEFAAEFMDEWKNIKKLYAIGGNSKNKKKLLTTSKYASTPDVLIEGLLQQGFGYAFDQNILQNFNGNAYDSLRLIVDAVQRAKDEFKLPNTQTIFGLGADEADDFVSRLSSAMGIIEQNIAAMRPAIEQSVASADKFADSAERAAVATERQTNAEIDLLSAIQGPTDAKMKQVEAAANAVSVEEIIARDVSEALERLRSSKNNETTLFSLKGVFDGEDLVNQAQEMVQNIAEQANLTLSSFNVKDDTIKVKLYNDELKVTVDQMYKLRAAAEDAESAQLELVSQSFTQNVKALNENNFDTDGMQRRALASIEKVRSSLHGLEYDLTDLEAAAKNIASHDDFAKFNNQLKAAQDSIQAIKNSTVSKNSMNPLANMQRDMQNANTEIETMRLKLEKFGDIQGVAEARKMIEGMSEAAKQYNQATDAQGQQSAYNQYSNLRSSYKAQTEYINAAKALNESQESAAKQTDPIKEQYKIILDLVNKINAANERMIKFQSIDGGSGLLSNKILDEQTKKLEAVDKLSSIMSELNIGDLLGKDQYTLPKDVQSIGTDYGQIASFINDAGVQASLTTEEIEKLVNALVKAGDIDLSMLDTAINSGNVKERAKQAAKEMRYFADKTRYTGELDIDQIANVGTAAENTKTKLENMAQSIAKNSDGAAAMIKGFSQSADGISSLDFSVFDTATNSLRSFRIEMGSVTDGVYVTETTINKSLANIQNAQKQLQSMGDLIGRLGASGVSVAADSAPTQVGQLLQTYKELSAELAKGDSADQDIISTLSQKAKLAKAEVEKLYKQMLQMESAIENGQMTGVGIGDPTGDVYGQLAQKAREFATTQPGATLELGRFDKATNTLNASLVYANGTVEEFKFQMNGLSGQMAQQHGGVKKLATSWDKFKASIASVGRQLMTAVVGYNIFFKAISEVRKGINYVKQIDLALTELKKVTDETEASYEKFLQTAADTAGTIGSTVSDFTEASANFARLGYTMSESADMAKTAIVYKNVADGLDTVEAATESIISTMKAFGVESKDTMGIVDRFNEVGNNFAITSAGIGEALQRSASALYAGGNTIDESIALVTAANSVVN